MPPRFSTTKLPQALRDELQKDSSADLQRPQKRTSLGRKAKRRLERSQAKINKLRFFGSEATSAPKRPAATPADELAQQIIKRAKKDEGSDFKPASNPVSKPSTSVLKPAHPSRPRASRNAAGLSPPARNLMKGKSAILSQVEHSEDTYIALLEKKLRLKKNSKGKATYGSDFEQDGLLDLLLGLDEKISNEEHSENASISDVGDDWDEKSSGSVVASEEWTGFDIEDEQDSEMVPFTDVQEVHYRPPQSRANASLETDERVGKLRRSLKGLLNRLSEQNMHAVLEDIETLYRTHSRHDFTSTLTDLIIEGTCSDSLLLDSFVAMHSGLLACLHRTYGVDISAFFIQRVVSTFDNRFKKAKSAYPEDTGINLGKDCSNLLGLLSNLYTFHVISCNLIYDYIRMILDGELTELDVELLLKFIRGAGPQLRQDDPSALKDIVQIVHSKVTRNGYDTSSRTKFMLETLENLKNNRLKQRSSESAASDSKDRIAKLVANLSRKRHTVTEEPLRFTLDDLRRADEKGRWWLVGAAWSGDPLVEKLQEQNSGAVRATGTQNLLAKLARKQKMNTDVRRSVFVVLMSSHDYIDACDRLGQLNLNDVQQREIIRVLLHCCGNEKSYNPYYTLIGDHLCKVSHGHRVTLQYCFWDFLRSMGETGVGGSELHDASLAQDSSLDHGPEGVPSRRLKNVAKAYAWWIAKNSIDITILKALDFVTLRSQSREFLEQLFTQLFIYTQENSFSFSLGTKALFERRNALTIQETMSKAARVSGLSNRLVYFLSLRMKSLEDADVNMVNFILWACEVARDCLQDLTGRREGFSG